MKTRDSLGDSLNFAIPPREVPVTVVRRSGVDYRVCGLIMRYGHPALALVPDPSGEPLLLELSVEETERAAELLIGRRRPQPPPTLN